MTVRALLTWAMYARLTAVAFLLCAAAGMMNHGDHAVLRVLIFLCGAFAVYAAWKAGSKLWTALLAAGTLLFNPVARLHLTRPLWTWLDMGVAAVFAASVFLLSERPAAPSAAGQPAA